MAKKHTNSSALHPAEPTKRPVIERPFAFSTTGPSRTQQHFKESCDINYIMKKYSQTGALMGNPNPPQFGDFASVPDYQDSLNLVINAEAQFSALPAEIRARFNNEPDAFLAFCENEKDPLTALGIKLPKPPPEVSPGTAAPAVPSETPEPQPSAPKPRKRETNAE